MSKIIKHGHVVEDNWAVLRLADDQDTEQIDVPTSNVIVPLAVWQAQHATLSARNNVGVWLASSERAEALKADIVVLPVIAVDFPKFSDGRGYSIAYNLRKRLGFGGELRAIGDVLRDQLFYMQRVGFDAFAIRPDRNIHEALKGLTDFSITYQAAVDQKSPLFRRVDRSTKFTP